MANCVGKNQLLDSGDNLLEAAIPIRDAIDLQGDGVATH